MSTIKSSVDSDKLLVSHTSLVMVAVLFTVQIEQRNIGNTFVHLSVRACGISMMLQ